MPERDPQPAGGIIDKTDLSVSVCCREAAAKTALGKNVIDRKGFRAKVRAGAVDMRALAPALVRSPQALDCHAAMGPGPETVAG